MPEIVALSSTLVARKYIRHCIVGKIKYGRHLCKVKQLIDIIFHRIKTNPRFWCLPDIIFDRQTIPKYF